MPFSYFVVLLAVGLAAVAVLGSVATIVSHAIRQRHSERQRLKRDWIFRQVLSELESKEFDPALVKAMRDDPLLGADLFAEMSDLVRGENRERVLALCREAGIDRWLLRRMRARSEHRRLVAAGTLKLFPGESTVEALRLALDDKAGAVRLTAALSLAELKAAPSIATLVHKLVESEGVQSLLLHRLLHPLAVDRPAEIMEVANGTIGRPFLRPMAVRALGESGHIELSGALSAFIEDPEPEVRAAALDAVASLGDFDAEDRVRKALADKVQFVRVRAIDAARRLELRGLVPELLTLLEDPNWWVRFRASETLAALGHKVPESQRKVVEFAPAAKQRVPAQRGAA